MNTHTFLLIELILLISDFLHGVGEWQGEHDRQMQGKGRRAERDTHREKEKGEGEK